MVCIKTSLSFEFLKNQIVHSFGDIEKNILYLNLGNLSSAGGLKKQQHIQYDIYKVYKKIVTVCDCVVFWCGPEMDDWN